MRRAVAEAHREHLNQLEERAGVPREQRSFLVLQQRPGDSILLLPGEGAGCDELRAAGEFFHRNGYSVLASSLAFRTLGEPGRSPLYWQTCVDEAENRYDILQHWSTRVVVLGVGLGATIALHLAAVRRVAAVLALFPTLHAAPGWRDHLRALLRKITPWRPTPAPSWSTQRELAAAGARDTMEKIAVPLFVLAEERRDRSDAGRSAQAAQRLMSRRATEVRVVRPGEVTSVAALPAALLEQMVTFARAR
jgi:pimeloyl-ACP methyl ester carboxylesterase